MQAGVAVGMKEQAVEPETQQMEQFKQFKSSVQMIHVDVEAAGMSHLHSWAAFAARTRTPLIILVAYKCEVSHVRVKEKCTVHFIWTLP